MLAESDEAMTEVPHRYSEHHVRPRSSGIATTSASAKPGERPNLPSVKSVELIAYHEAGHAVAAVRSHNPMADSIHHAIHGPHRDLPRPAAGHRETAVCERELAGAPGFEPGTP